MLQRLFIVGRAFAQLWELDFLVSECGCVCVSKFRRNLGVAFVFVKASVGANPNCGRARSQENVGVGEVLFVELCFGVYFALRVRLACVFTGSGQVAGNAPQI